MGDREEYEGELAVRVPESMRAAFERAQRYVERYFAERIEDPVRGIIEHSGNRYVLVRAASMSTEFYDLVMGLYRDRGETEARNVASSFLFDMAHAIGKADARVFHEEMGVTDPIERLSAGPIHFAFSGWALVDILAESRPSPDEDYFLTYNHPYSFEADSWLRSGKQVDFPVCTMSAGYSSGWCEESFGLPLVAVEVQCRAAGDDDCRFIMAPPSRIQERLAEYAPQAETPRPGREVEVPEFFKRKRLEEELRRHKDNLEEMIVARTRELTAANKRLRSEIEERKRVEGQLAQATRMEAVGVLAAGLAHDFNNLLTSILAGVQLTIRSGVDNPKAMEWLRHAETATERASDLTRQMLAFGHRHTVDAGPVDIAAIVASTADFLRDSLPNRITVVAEPQPEQVVICVDSSEVEYALINLALNARDAMPLSGVLTFGAEVVDLDDAAVERNAAARPGKFVRLSVSDTGSGIEPAILGRIFEPYFTTKDSDVGTGLGLARVYACARAHDGWVSVTSELGRGSTFEIYLPFVPPPPETHDEIKPELHSGDETLLLVDDTEPALYSAKSILESCGYEVLVARDGSEALEEVERTGRKVQVVVTDLVMPKADGRALLSELRQRGVTIPVILTSGHAAQSDGSQFVEQGFAAFVAKPFDAATLSSIVRRVLDDASA